MKRRYFLGLMGSFMLSFKAGLASDFSKVKIGFLPISDHFLIIAKELFNNFTAIKFNSWAELSEAFRAGSLDAAFMLNPLALKLSTQLPLKALMAAHRNGSALCVAKHILSASDLKGKKIAVPSRFSTHFLLLNEFLKQNQIALSEIKIIDMSPPEMPFSLKNGFIDGFFAAQPYANLANNFNFSRTLRLSSEILNSHSCCLFVASNGLLKNEKMCEDLVFSLVQTAEFIKQNKALSAKFANKIMGHKAELLQGLIENENELSFDNLRIEKKDFDFIKNSLDDLNLGLNVKYDELVENKFINQAYKRLKNA